MTFDFAWNSCLYENDFMQKHQTANKLGVICKFKLQLLRQLFCLDMLQMGIKLQQHLAGSTAAAWGF